MLNLIFNFLFLVLLSIMTTSLFIKFSGLTFWWGTVFLFFLGISLYFLNVFFIRYFINKKAPGILELDELYGKPMKDGEYLWEKTAGTGTIPKWVSWIAVWSWASFAGIILWILVWIKKC